VRVGVRVAVAVRVGVRVGVGPVGVAVGVRVGVGVGGIEVVTDRVYAQSIAAPQPGKSKLRVTVYVPQMGWSGQVPESWSKSTRHCSFAW